MVGMLPAYCQDLILVHGLARGVDGEEDISKYEKQKDYIVKLVENKIEELESKRTPKADANAVDVQEYTKEEWEAKGKGRGCFECGSMNHLQWGEFYRLKFEGWCVRWVFRVKAVFCVVMWLGRSEQLVSSTRTTPSAPSITPTWVPAYILAQGR